MQRVSLCHMVIAGILFWSQLSARSAEITGVTITPHVIAESMKYRLPRDPDIAALVKIFVRGGALPGSFSGKSPEELLKSGDWAWHDLNTAVKGPEESLSVWTFNGKSTRWGVGQSFEIQSESLPVRKINIETPDLWISSITFPGELNQAQPNQMVLHLVNQKKNEIEIHGLVLWLPKEGKSWQTLYPTVQKSLSLKVPAEGRGVLSMTFDKKLPLTYAAIEIKTNHGSLWEHLRIKSEYFDISGGWTGEYLQHEAYLKLLSSLHVNCGQIQQVGGYTDNPKLSARFPMKMFNRMMPLEKWDSDEWLSRIHAVEFLGEPQYGGGRPVPPQEVFEAFLPYRTSRLATSVTHSEERVWRYYAGLSDFPHYDAYRVVAPAADSWREYDRWNSLRISWGAPLETIGDMSRSLRELNRPMPVAFWAQGPHDGWGGGFRRTGRSRRSPTPDELRSQAIHGLSARITSLYWFNLSLKSLMKFPDTWEPLQRIGREIKMLAPIFLTGDAFEYQRMKSADGRPDWDLSSIIASDAAVLFAIDLAYQPDPVENIFKFGEPRDFSAFFTLPHWLRGELDLFRVDAEGLHEVQWKPEEKGVRITGKFSRDAIFIAAKSPETRRQIQERRVSALAWEEKNRPAAADLELLKSLISKP